MHNYPSITNRKVRLALVGCGRIAANHFASIESHADSVDLVDVCDVNPVALAQAVARTQATGHSSLTGCWACRCWQLPSRHSLRVVWPMPSTSSTA